MSYYYKLGEKHIEKTSIVTQGERVRFRTKATALMMIEVKIWIAYRYSVRRTWQYLPRSHANHKPTLQGDM